MRAVASISATTATGGSVSLFATVGVGVGGIFVTALLVYLLAYLNVLNASERNRERLQSLLVAAILPLTFVFFAFVLYQSLAVLGFL